MRQIDVSTRVYALIWALRREGEESEDDILARVLPLMRLEPASASSMTRPSQESMTPSASAVAGGKKGEGKMRWVDDIVTALNRLGGQASLDEIYRTTKSIRQSAGRSLTRQWQATIRRTLEDHSSDSANYRAENLFRIVGRGIWALR